VPTLGFYGQFTPLVQGYSCAESPFWLGKAFLCLHLPKDHPFWTAKENNGTWEKLEHNEVKVTTLDGPALCFSNHEANGETILRTGKVVKTKGDIHGMWNYSKLCFNTKYPWEATPISNGIAQDNIASQQYVLHDITTDTYENANATFWHGEKDEVLYRRQFFNYNLETETHWIQAINLADFTVPYGIIRADRMRFFKKPISITLGSYGFPDNGKTQIIKKESEYNDLTAKAIILKGYDHNHNEKQLAMTIYDGWDDIDLIKSQGTNPDSENSIVIYAATKRKNHNHYEKMVLISQVITKESHEDFTDADIFPIEKVLYTDKEHCGGYGPVEIILKTGTSKIINFEQIEGRLML
jgi:hypothetical protein